MNIHKCTTCLNVEDNLNIFRWNMLSTVFDLYRKYIPKYKITVV